MTQGMTNEPTVMLTGATGFLGGEVLARLLERHDATIYALVRADGDGPAQARLREVLDSLHPDAERWRERVVAVPGDITQPDLGLDRTRRAWLAERVDRVIHCAASVSFTLGLDESRAINVDGTRRVLDFAELCAARGGLDSVVHVSTAYVAGTHDGEFGEEDLDLGQGFRNAYERSKFEAELLVRERAAELPVQVVRPSVVVGDSRTGWTSSFNVLYSPLRAFQRGTFPALPARRSSPVDVVPVDYVADGILALAGRPGATHHLTASSRASTVGEIIELASADAGRPAPRVLPPALYRVVLHPLLVRSGSERRRRALRRSEVFFPYFAVRTQFDNRGAREALTPLQIEAPPLPAYFDRLTSFAREARWGRRPIPRHAASAITSEARAERRRRIERTAEDAALVSA
jgi:thioester reductase-like protein